MAQYFSLVSRAPSGLKVMSDLGGNLFLGNTLSVWDVIIIGGGPAGLTAAVYATRAGLSVLLLEAQFTGGQMGNATEIDNYPGYPEATGVDLSMRMEDHAKKSGAQIQYEEVTSLSKKSDGLFQVVAAQTYQARSIIYAAGAKARTLGLPSEYRLAGRGVSYCAICDGAFFKGKRVAVIGGGNTAVGDALYLSGICSQVLLIHRRDSLRAERVLQDRLKQTENIQMIWNATVEEVIGQDLVSAIKVKDTVSGNTHEEMLSAVFVAIGAKPFSDLLQSFGIVNEYGYIQTDEWMCTKIPGLFIAGDVRHKPLRQVVTAAADGAVAATAAEKFIHHEPYTI